MTNWVEIRLEQSTPAFVGHYEPELVDEWFFLKPTSVKGIWRWFARALVAGALYDLGMLYGEPDKEMVKKPTKLEAKEISRIVGKVMGLGYAGERKESEASMFRVGVETLRRPRVQSTRGAFTYVRSRQVRLQRVGLLTLTGRAFEYFEGGTFRLVVERAPFSQPKGEGEELALRALILALTLSGVGKASRKCLGSLDVVDVKGFNVEKNLRDFMDATYKLALDLVERQAKLERAPAVESLPPLPSIAKRKVKGWLPFSLHRIDSASWVDTHNFFLRSERCRKLTGDPLCQDALRAQLEAWILGMPRSQKGTGYFSEGVERRASPIFVTYHEDRHMFGRGVLVATFASADWPSSLKWQGTGSEPITVSEGLIARALSDALEELWKYLGSTPSGVWP